jgi:glycosyltransferase involved in cell wall biosynthesis
MLRTLFFDTRGEKITCNRFDFSLFQSRPENHAVFRRSFLIGKDTPLRAIVLIRESIAWICSLIKENIALHLLSKVRRVQCYGEEKKAVIVVTSLIAGGAERQAILLAKQLVSDGWEVFLVCLKKLDGEHGHYTSELIALNVTVFELEKVKTSRDPCFSDSLNLEASRIVSLLPNHIGTLVEPLSRLLEKQKPMFVHALLDHANIITALAGTLAGVPSIGISFRNGRPSYFEFCELWFKKYYHHSIKFPWIKLSGNSPWGNEDYADWLGISARSIKLTPNGVECERFKPDLDKRKRVRESLHLDDATLMVVGIFRLAPRKRPMDALLVASKVVQVLPDVKFYIFGDGPLRYELESAIEKLSLNKHFFLMGTTRNPEDYFASADVAFLFSEWEGMPNTVLEAQSSGLPVVATHVGGIPCIIRNGNTGFLFPPGDISSATRAVLRVLGSRLLRDEMSSQARRHIVENFSMRSAANAVYQLHELSRDTHPPIEKQRV